MKRRTIVRAAVLAGGVVASGLAASPATAADQHPFLLVSAGEFDALRARAAGDPWATWASEALVRAGAEYVSSAQEPNVGIRAKQLAQIAGTASLSYILDVDNASTHRHTLLSLIQSFGTDIQPYLNTSSWDGTVPPSGALFHLVIGYDVIYDTLSVTERSTAEAVFAAAADWFYTYRNNTNWQTARIGGYGIWAAFKRSVDTVQAARLAECVTQLRAANAAVSSTPPATGSSEAYLTGSTYAGNRLGSTGDRDSKSYVVDVLTKIGAFDFYNDPLYRSLIEHYSGYLVTPVTRTGDTRDEFTFGDSWAAGGAVYRSARTYSAHKFGAVAAANAGWSLRGVSPSATLPLITTYVLCNQAPQQGTMVPSRVFPRAGAWFHQRSTSNLALSAALWCPVKATHVEHQHKDTNALHLTAYGEHVLRNSGYSGYGTASAGFSYDVIANRAVVNNTVLLDYPPFTTDGCSPPFTGDCSPPTLNDHVLLTDELPSAGITESLLWNDLDYACADSGSALPNGQHHRSLVFVHPNTTCQGYWAVFDEVDAQTGGVDASVAWHPNSMTDPTAVTGSTEYVSAIDVNMCTANNVKLAMFLATPPSSVSVKSGPLAEWVVSSKAGRYLYCTYPTDSAGAKHIATVLFPFDDSHPKATMIRMGGTGYTGASVALNPDTTDYVLASDGATPVTTAGVSWLGRAAVFRLDATGLRHYLVRKGLSLRYGAYGFSAPAEVSVNCRAKGGLINNASTGAVNVTFYEPGLVKVRLNGVPAPVTASGIGWLTVTVPAGTWNFELVTVPAYEAVADTYVRNGDTFANDNYGSGTTIVVKADTSVDYQREGYLKFDLAAFGSAAVTSARIRLHAEATGGGSYTIEASHVTDSSWTESALTWATKPASGTVLSTVPAPSPGTVVNFDVTGQVNAVLAASGSKMLSVRIRIRENGSANSVTFSSCEQSDATRRPVIELTP